MSVPAVADPDQLLVPPVAEATIPPSEGDTTTPPADEPAEPDIPGEVAPDDTPASELPPSEDPAEPAPEPAPAPEPGGTDAAPPVEPAPEQPAGSAVMDQTPVTITMSSPTTGPFGPITVTALVDGTGSNPTGTVAITTTPDVGSCPSAPLSASGADDATASCPLTPGPTPGQVITVNISYAGDGTHDANTGSGTYLADKAVPTITVAPSGIGPSGSVVFTATVTGSHGTPGGTVSFATTPTVGGCASVALSGSGSSATATCNLITIPPGQAVTVTATYSGDTTYDIGTPGTAIYTGKSMPMVTVTGPTSPGMPGPQTFNVTVTGSGGIDPTGTVTLTTMPDIGSCTTNPLTPGPGTDDAVGSCQLTFSPGPAITITATYSGDGSYEAGTPGSTNYRAKFVAVVTVNAQNGVTQGPATMTFVATVTGVETPTPSGMVTFAVAPGGSLCSNPVALTGSGASWQATCQITGMPLNTDVTVTATYSGNADYLPSDPGQTVYQTATAPVTVTITAPPGSGEVPFTVTVTSSDGGMPTGTVTLTLVTQTALRALVADQAASCTATLAPVPGRTDQASGTCTLTVPPGATFTVQAAYNGSAQYLINTAQTSFKGLRTPTVTLTVNPPSPVPVGTAVTFTARVGADASGIIPTGTIRFEVAGQTVAGCEAVPLSGGQATCTTTALPAGTLRIVVGYSGDAEYLAGSAEFGNYVVASTLLSTSLPDSGANVAGLLLGALLLILAGAGLVVFGAPRPERVT